MVASKTVTLTAAERLTHEEACRLADLAARTRAQTIILDLSHTHDASTAGFARLVLLRRKLLKFGCDIWLAGLTDRAARLFEVHRLEGVLPRLSEIPQSAPVRRSTRRIAPDPMAHLSTIAAG